MDKRWIGSGVVAATALAATVLTVAGAWAAPHAVRGAAVTIAQPGTNAWATAKGYLPKDVLDGIALLGPPPAPDSLIGQADRQRFDETRSLQGSPRWTLAAQDADLNTGVVHRFSCAVGGRIGEGTPTLRRLLFKLQYDVRDVGNRPKDHYARPRPLIGNDKPICVKREAWMASNASYPSGHSMIGWSWALVLAELAPDRAETLMENARDFAESRVICGVHYQSDVDAGRTLGAAMVAREHAEPAFRADLARAKLELQRARKGPPPEDCGAYAAG
ncbi:acid phosphatase [Caulobacter sp. KR2-114]|uniref:acid phosphatase n=1 Tax=Caulobacter sp. KR2-114 TaxID=3400912 RepID=UPI003C02F0D4